MVTRMPVLRASLACGGRAAPMKGGVLVEAMAHCQAACAAGHTNKNRDDPKDPVNDWLLYDRHCGLTVEKAPKGAFHFLIFPRQTRYKCLNDLRRGDVDLLGHMGSLAEQVVAAVRACADETMNEAFQPGALPLCDGREFRPRPSLSRFFVGFQAVQQLPQLQLDVVSLDFAGQGLKSKVQYNRLATPFLLPHADMLADVKQHGCVTINQAIDDIKGAEHRPLTCLWCGAGVAREEIPSLRAHHGGCEKFLPGLSGDAEPTLLAPVPKAERVV